MIKVKNVRAGIVIIADAGLKLAPGETVEVENPTGQVEKAIVAGLLARVDAEPETKPKAKAAGRTADSKGESKKPTSPATTPKQLKNPEDKSGQEASETGEEQLTGTTDGSN